MVDVVFFMGVFCNRPFAILVGPKWGAEKISPERGDGAHLRAGGVRCGTQNTI